MICPFREVLEWMHKCKHKHGAAVFQLVLFGVPGVWPGDTILTDWRKCKMEWWVRGGVGWRCLSRWVWVGSWLTSWLLWYARDSDHSLSDRVSYWDMSRGLGSSSQDRPCPGPKPGPWDPGWPEEVEGADTVPLGKRIISGLHGKGVGVEPARRHNCQSVSKTFSPNHMGGG